MSEEQSTVTYRDIPGFPGYRAGDDGSVWSCWTMKRPTDAEAKYNQKWWKGDNFYQMKTNSIVRKGKIISIRLRLKSESGKMCGKLVHVLILNTFVGPCPEGMECAHKDGNPSNNKLTNLRWTTPKDNQADKKIHGTQCQGATIGNAVFTNEDVIKILDLYSKGTRVKELVKMFNTHKSQIYSITRGYTWSSVTGIPPKKWKLSS